jgi:hypothetical protein
MRTIPALGRLRQEDCEFQASLGYMVRSCLKTTAMEKKKERKEKHTNRALKEHILYGLEFSNVP